MNQLISRNDRKINPDVKTFSADNAFDWKKNLYYQVIKLEVTQGHLKWKISDLSKITLIPRPTIYYHFGKRKLDMVLAAAEFFGEFVSGTDKIRMKLYEEKKILTSFQLSREFFYEYPELLHFYWDHRNKDSLVKPVILKFENLFLDKLQYYFKVSREDASVLATLIWGISSTPFEFSLSKLRNGLGLLGEILQNTQAANDIHWIV